MSTPAFDPTSELAAKVEFTFPIAYTQMRLLTPMPGEESRILAVVRPFQPTVGYDD